VPTLPTIASTRPSTITGFLLLFFPPPSPSLLLAAPTAPASGLIATRDDDATPLVVLEDDILNAPETPPRLHCLLVTTADGDDTTILATATAADRRAPEKIAPLPTALDVTLPRCASVAMAGLDAARLETKDILNAMPTETVP
jgi:hypothetical protein